MSSHPVLPRLGGDGRGSTLSVLPFSLLIDPDDLAGAVYDGVAGGAAAL